jgi:hypothetical protein
MHLRWSDFTENYRTVEWVHMNFTDEDMVRRAELLAEAARLVKRIHGGGGSGGGEDDGPKRTQESADAMFALLMAEEATKSRWAQPTLAFAGRRVVARMLVSCWPLCIT